MGKTFKFQIQHFVNLDGGSIKTNTYTYPLPPACANDEDCTNWLEANMAQIMANEHIDMVINFVVIEVNGVKCSEGFLEKSKTENTINGTITYLFENDGLANSDTIRFVQEIDKNYKEINTEVRGWSRESDYWLFAMLINPNLKNIVSSSGFVTSMPFEYINTFDKKISNKEDDFDILYPQLAYFAYMIQQALYYRQKHNMQPLHIHLNYIEPHDLMEDIIVNEKFHADCAWSVRAMLRHCEKYVFIHVYKDYILQKTYINEDELPAVK